MLHVKQVAFVQRTATKTKFLTRTTPKESFNSERSWIAHLRLNFLCTDVSVYLCEFVAINELSSSLHAPKSFLNSCDTFSWHLSRYQGHQISVKSWQFSPSHTCSLLRKCSKLAALSYRSAWTNHNKNYDVMAETSSRDTQPARTHEANYCEFVNLWWGDDYSRFL